MHSTPILEAHAIVLLAFFFRAFTGFGGALLSIPLLALYYDIKFVVSIECVLEVFLSFILVKEARKDFDRPRFRRIVGGAFVGSWIGVFVLKGFASPILKTLLGFVVMTTTIILAIARKARRKVNGSASSPWPAKGYAFGVIGGVLGGMFGTSGPAYITYLEYEKVEADIFRNTLILIFAIEYGVRCVIFGLLGFYSWNSLIFALWLAPALSLGTWFGVRTKARVVESRFQIIVYILLFVSGLLLSLPWILALFVSNLTQ